MIDEHYTRARAVDLLRIERGLIRARRAAKIAERAAKLALDKAVQEVEAVRGEFDALPLLVQIDAVAEERREYAHKQAVINETARSNTGD